LFGGWKGVTFLFKSVEPPLLASSATLGSFSYFSVDNTNNKNNQSCD